MPGEREAYPPFAKTCIYFFGKAVHTSLRKYRDGGMKIIIEPDTDTAKSLLNWNPFTEFIAKEVAVLPFSTCMVFSE